VDPFARELPVEVDLEDSDEDEEEKQPGKKIYTNMMAEEDYTGDAPTFAHSGLQVPINILFNQIEGFTLHPREGVGLSCITPIDDMSPDIQGLKKYFTLRNPC
jgi:hypothetical protein